ncbi:MAG TPA: riboflavin synthase [Deltaproteobacteria bacterium]|nr:riboflavin synthase [Deltaproteobacteria bacterium]
MFTGIVETVGKIVRVERREDLAKIVVDAPLVCVGLKCGDSIAVNGACLTVIAIEGGRLSFEAIVETLARTNLGDLAIGAGVNLERAMRADQRLDGHIVQGHVDAVGRVRALDREGADVRLFIECDPRFSALLVDKGSVAVDGVSLTVVHTESHGFDVALIPHTLESTTLGQRRVGDRVNLEADVLGKYVKQYVERVLGHPAAESS